MSSRPDVGHLYIFDTQTHKFVHKSSPPKSKVRYIEEGPDGLVLGYASGGGGTNHGSRIFVFDTHSMRTTRIIRMPWTVQHSQYASPVRFERGPDKRIYFYGSDDYGTALFRVDGLAGEVDAVARGKGITDVSQYGVNGATFVFAPKSIFFGGLHLVSVPLENITGPSTASEQPPPAKAAAPAASPSLHHALPTMEVEAARQEEEQRMQEWLKQRNAGVPASVPELLQNVWQARLPRIQWDMAEGPSWGLWDTATRCYAYVLAKMAGQRRYPFAASHALTKNRASRWRPTPCWNKRSR